MILWILFAVQILGRTFFLTLCLNYLTLSFRFSWQFYWLQILHCLYISAYLACIFATVGIYAASFDLSNHDISDLTRNYLSTFSLMLSHALLITSLSSKFSKAANLLEMLTWFCSLILPVFLQNQLCNRLCYVVPYLSCNLVVFSRRNTQFVW